MSGVGTLVSAVWDGGLHRLWSIVIMGVGACCVRVRLVPRGVRAFCVRVREVLRGVELLELELW